MLHRADANADCSVWREEKRKKERKINCQSICLTCLPVIFWLLAQSGSSSKYCFTCFSGLSPKKGHCEDGCTVASSSSLFFFFFAVYFHFLTTLASLLFRSFTSPSYCSNAFLVPVMNDTSGTSSQSSRIFLHSHSIIHRLFDSLLHFTFFFLLFLVVSTRATQISLTINHLYV